MGRGACRGTREECAATPEEHFGNALVALPEPLARNYFPGELRQPQKVQRMIRSENERLTRWEGAVNGKSDADESAEVPVLQSRLRSAGKHPSNPTASPARHPHI